MSGLSPDRPAEIDLVLIGERAGAGTDGTADEGALEGSANHQAAERAHSGADSAAADRALTGAATAG